MVDNQTPDIPGMWVAVVGFFFCVLGCRNGVKEAASEGVEWHKSLVWVQQLLVQGAVCEALSAHSPSGAVV